MHRFLTKVNHLVRKVYLFLAFVMLLCLGCEWRLRATEESDDEALVNIERYDRVEALYLTTGDYAALGQMNTAYPKQTRMLIENILQLGKVDDPLINQKFLHFFQDSTLQMIIAEVERQYTDVDDLNNNLSEAFEVLCKLIPSLEVPQVYTQIGSLDQSIVVGDGLLGISLDKYLGSDNQLYAKYEYSSDQLRMMERAFIVPDCLGFYLLSLYPIPAEREWSLEERHRHMGRIQWVVNRAMKRKVFDNVYVAAADRLMNEDESMTVDLLLKYI